MDKISSKRVRVRNPKKIEDPQKPNSTPCWILVPQTFDELKTKCCAVMNADTSRSLLMLSGCEIVSVDVLRDGDMIDVVDPSTKFFADVEDQSTKFFAESVETSNPDKWITFNVGGRNFTTTISTLFSAEPNSMLAKMTQTDLDGKSSWNHRRDANGAVLIDRSGELFEILLNYLRTGRLMISERDNVNALFLEAEFYNFENLMVDLMPFINAYNRDRKIVEVPGKSTTLTRADIIRALIVTPSTQELRFQGLDLEGCDLSKLDLRCINFKMSNLRGANLSYANISYVNFERADLTGAILDHATMFGVKMPCAIMERISMQSVNTDDPAGLRANFEGVNLRMAKIDNSQLNGANFRVANLKFASMKNCELKQASFPGANMEKCDMSGSNLFEANLRGANLFETNFGHLANALHMSQTI